jgi:hypothetical protein
MKRTAIYMVILILFATVEMAGAVSLIVDQTHMQPVNSWHNLSYYNIDQEFTPSFTSLNIIELEISVDSAETRVKYGAIMQVKILEGSLDGPEVAGSKKLRLPRGFSGIAQFLFPSSVPLVPGTPYILDIELLSGSAHIASSYEEGGYPDGKMFIDGINYSTDMSDVIFQTGRIQKNLIHINQGSNSAFIDLGSAVTTRVTVNSSDIFDATTLDPATLNLAGAGVVVAEMNGKYPCREEYANNDDYPDLICNLDTRQMVLEEGEVIVTMEAETYDGILIVGEDTVYVVQ